MNERIRNVLKSTMKRNMKGFVWDPLILGITLLPCLAIVLIIMTTIWLSFGPQLEAFTTASGSPTGAAVIANLGNLFFLDIGNSMIIIMYFAMFLVIFVNARQEAADPTTLGIGLLIMIVGLVVSFPISDAAYNMLTSPGLIAAAAYYTDTLYLLDSMPVITAIGTLVYFVLIITGRPRGSPTGGPISSG